MCGPGGARTVLIKAPVNSKAKLKTTTRDMFKTFTFAAIPCGTHSPGITLDSGMAALTMCPSEGCVLPLTTLHLDLGGWDLTDDLMEILTELGYFFITTGQDHSGPIGARICKTTYNSIIKCGDIHEDLYASPVLSGAPLCTWALQTG
ncbi:hypothetical protein mRhiFer1_008197 [Rhinolophus ferrumequinum]|uniref:Uncharacterized protein n=1 Tax=Rhinolophus ferrumequinum TaxID=59479 RepID=A0A7J7W810_RHIFE|nr:hypothetical protein mRhiFer1_008197 [Rhinolophus ferrumequinum]